ncbi:IPT/TIG domain-containing protein [Catalinimonas niigatensis]|uniref:IPT/TIG domain-containing protein n=1 Tax=Catalinimonas niigatensis TaxID=1397264 RepID=UPI0026669CE4|nr:IPT/TIG domain-containing protein [Catalinimonas niigatensis]WPP53160.1 IPT/TIG domain-containing protein [Catalinimonas niigatensis]
MKKLSLTLLLTLGLMATFFTACEDDEPDPGPQQPTITTINPSSGAVDQQITITGTNFGSSPTVTFGSTNATVTNASNTSITTTVPTGLATGAVQVTVTANGMTSSASTFTVTEEPVEGPAELYITDEDLADGTYNWVNDTTYFLTGLVYLEEGGVLNIEEGTTIRFTADAGDDNTSALVITQGSQIFAEGTAENPIIFTSEADTTGAGLLPTDNGLWGGLLILGDAPAEKGGATADISIEGIDSSEPRGTYGGTTADDNSGILQYVSIRYTGVGLAPNSEIQGLTLGGVGSGTTIDHIDIYSSGDDGIEIFGGTVNISHISVAFATDDSFDFDEGWRGNGQYLFALQLEGGEEDFDQVGEWDGAVPDDASLYSAPNIFNATLIGPGQNSTDVLRGLLIRDGFAGKFGNSIMEDFPGVAFQVEDRDGIEYDSYGRLVTETAEGFQLEILNNTFAAFGGATDLASLVEATSGEDEGYAGATEAVVAELTDNNNVFSADPVLSGVSRTTDGGLDPRPAAATAATATVPSGLEQVEYRGAFVPGEATWLSGWSTLSQLGYLVD